MLRDSYRALQEESQTACGCFPKQSHVRSRHISILPRWAKFPVERRIVAD